MSVYDIKITSFNQLPGFGSSAVISDCDGTLFYPGSTELYPDVLEKIKSVACLALVSANPDKDLLEERMRLVGADIGNCPPKAKWNKKTLFGEAAQQVIGVSSMRRAVIVGDRPLMDVEVGQQAFRKEGFETVGVCVARPELPVPSTLDYLLRPTYRICSVVAKRIGQDERFRPTPDQGYERFASFINL